MDQRSGVEVHLNGGWVQLPIDNALFPARTAKAVFAHPRSQQFVALLEEYIPDSRLGANTSPVDRYIDLVLQARRKALPSLIETRPRSSGQCAGLPARSAWLSWNSEGRQSAGAVTAFNDGQSWWLLSTFFYAGSTRTADGALSELQRSVSATKTLDARVGEAARRLISPLYSQRAAELMVRRLWTQRLDLGEAQQFGFALTARGFDLLPAAEQLMVQGLRERATQTLSRAQQDEMSRLAAIATRDRKSKAAMEAATQWTKLLYAAIGNLAPQDQERLKHLVEREVILATEGD